MSRELRPVRPVRHFSSRESRDRTGYHVRPVRHFLQRCPSCPFRCFFSRLAVTSRPILSFRDTLLPCRPPPHILPTYFSLVLFALLRFPFSSHFWACSLCFQHWNRTATCTCCYPKIRMYNTSSVRARFCCVIVRRLWRW